MTTAYVTSAGPLRRFGALTCDVLLLGGTRSATFLTTALDRLEPVIPHRRRVTYRRVGHLAADDSGRPDAVATTLRVFFSRPGSATVGATVPSAA